MSKRGAETSLSKDNWEDKEDENEEVDTTQSAEASADKLAGRTFVKVRRKPEAPEAAAGFNLTGSTSAAGGFNFDFSKKPEAASTKSETASSDATTAPSTTATATANSTTTSTTSTPAPAQNGFMFLMNPDNWECPSCEVSNKKGTTKCAACETPKPGSEPAAAAAPAASGFTFGAATTTPFTFGSSLASTGGFSFGSTTSTWNFSSTPDSPFTFGSNANAVTFGDVSGTTFGSAGDATTFEPQEGLATGGDQTKEEFKNKAAEPSGTEKDTTIFKIPTIVYILSKVESPAEDGKEKKEQMKFVENGEGELKVNTVQDGDKKIARVVLRVEKTQRLVLNAPLFSGTTVGLQGDKYVKFASNDLEGKPAVYLLRFKNKTETTQAKEHMEKAIAFTAGK